MSSTTNPKSAGFDAAIKRREDDHLNRWPLAQEIYGIATTGPDDWSVRIGIYGEWGTGKTSVLEFVAEMAQKDGHTVIRFNPWQYAAKDALWRGFVTTIYNQPIFYSMERAGWVRIKKKSRWLLDRGRIAEEGTRILNDTAGKAVAAGLDIAKGWFNFSKDDLTALRKELGSKRVLILIDDLDRTSPELVPEILFALKELMDVPAFSFVCAFDPSVVGTVLSLYNPGFGDGLKFLEKIIDYPRWLPPAAVGGLADLAVSDAKNYCPYVPESDLREVIPLLPANPRAIRQFTRLIALLGPQIDRHYEYELNWPIILAANALKTSYPLLSYVLLKDEEFIGMLKEKSFGAQFRDQPKANKRDVFLSHVKRTAEIMGVSLSEISQDQIVRMLDRIFSVGNILLWIDEPKISYQLNIAEAPHAVTWKEYDRFLGAWRATHNGQAAESWINDHARDVNRSPLEVWREVFQATVRRYAETLRGADGVLTQQERQPIIETTSSLIALLECFTFDLGRLNQPDKPLGTEDLELPFETFASILSAVSPVHAQFRRQNEDLLLKLVQEWGPDLGPLLKLLQIYGHFPGRYFAREGTFDLHKKLCGILLPRLATHIITSLGQPGFITRLFDQERETYSIRGAIFDSKSPLWTTLRNATLTALKEAQSNRTVQENAYELIHMFDFKLYDESTVEETGAIRTLLSDPEVLNAIWTAAVATPLNLQATGRLKRFVAQMQAANHSMPLPAWWDENIKAIRAQVPEEGPGGPP